jgi:hypothetical protein
LVKEDFMEHSKDKLNYPISKSINIENIQIDINSLIVDRGKLSIDYSASKGDKKVVIENFFLLLEKGGDWTIFLPEEWDHHIKAEGFCRINSDNMDLPFDSMIMIIVDVSVYNELQNSVRHKEYNYEKTSIKRDLGHLLSAIVNKFRKISKDTIFITKPVVLVNSFNKYFSSENIKQVFLDNFFTMLNDDLFWEDMGNLSTFLASPAFLYNSLLDYFALGENNRLFLAEPGPFLNNNSDRQVWIDERKNEISRIINSESETGSIKSGDCLYHLMDYIGFVFELRESIKDDYSLNRDRHNPIAVGTMKFTRCDEEDYEKEAAKPPLNTEQILELTRKIRYEEIKHHIHIKSIENTWRATSDSILMVLDGQVIAQKKKSIKVDSIDWE